MYNIAWSYYIRKHGLIGLAISKAAILYNEHISIFICSNLDVVRVKPHVKELIEFEAFLV